MCMCLRERGLGAQRAVHRQDKVGAAAICTQSTLESVHARHANTQKHTNAHHAQVEDTIDAAADTSKGAWRSAKVGAAGQTRAFTSLYLPA